MPFTESYTQRNIERIGLIEKSRVQVEERSFFIIENLRCPYNHGIFGIVLG